MKQKPIILVASTFPDDIELLSESLVTAYGLWESNQVLFLDSAHAFSGYCIGARNEAAGALGLNLRHTFSPPVDIRNFPIVCFLHLLDGSIAGFLGDSFVSVKAEWYVGTTRYFAEFYKEFVTAPGIGKGAWSSKRWNLLTDFDFHNPYGTSKEEAMSKINVFSVWSMFNTDIVQQIQGQRMFLDRIYFTQEHSFLQVRSEPPGKTFTFDGYAFVTPTLFEGVPGDTHEVIMSDTEFSEWEDHSTNRVRVVTMPPAKETLVITAYYVGVTPPDEGITPPPANILAKAALGIGVLCAVAGSVYLLGGKQGERKIYRRR